MGGDSHESVQCVIVYHNFNCFGGMRNYNGKNTARKFRAVSVVCFSY